MAIILFLQPTDSFQTYLDILVQNGGGILNLNPVATFFPTADINIPSNVTLNGNGGTIDFGGQAFGIKMLGTNGNPILNSSLTNLMITNSSTTGIETDWTDNPLNIIFDDITVTNCAVGASMDNGTSIGIIGFFSNNGINCQISNSTGIEFHFVGFSDSTSGDGVVLSSCSSSTLFDSGMEGNFGNGISLTDCSDMSLVSLGLIGNAGDGIKLVSGNSRIVITATGVSDNTGFGINIADASNTSTVIVANTTLNNTAGALNDAGTGTLASVTVNSFA